MMSELATSVFLFESNFRRVLTAESGTRYVDEKFPQIY